jgi:D-glycero-alpha-D-manno-heptose 1-phosphate guanylyltransferase
MSAYPHEAIVLAGGMGTRLQTVVRDIPKPMASVDGRPFLEYVLAQLPGIGIQRVVLSVGYKWEVILAHFGHSFMGMEIDYAVEEQPLGTGGGIKLAFDKTTSEQVLVLNGDTLFACDLRWHFAQHTTDGGLISLALKEMHDFDRYGSVEVDADRRVMGFKEKQALDYGLINAGVYVIDRALWAKVDVAEKFSFEKDILERYVGALSFMGYKQDGYFIDIGIPEDYARAQMELPNLQLGFGGEDEF